VLLDTSTVALGLRAEVGQQESVFSAGSDYLDCR
jgi:hypothetical protein